MKTHQQVAHPWQAAMIVVTLFAFTFTLALASHAQTSCAGAFSAGWSLNVADGKPAFDYNAFELATMTVQGSQRLPEGEVPVKVVFAPDVTSKIGGGTMTLSVDGQMVGGGKLERTLFRHGLEPFEAPVANDYQMPFKLTGKLSAVTIELDGIRRPTMT